jgi:transposase
MIPVPLSGCKVWVFMQAVDMRRSYDSLYGLVKSFNSAPLSGDLFVFLSSDRKKAKVLLWHKNGLMIIMKRLEEGKFANILSRGTMSSSELMLFMDGSSSVKEDLSAKDLSHKFDP